MEENWQVVWQAKPDNSKEKALFLLSQGIQIRMLLSVFD
jgi:hypothetical protein